MPRTADRLAGHVLGNEPRVRPSRFVIRPRQGSGSGEDVPGVRRISRNKDPDRPGSFVVEQDTANTPSSTHVSIVDPVNGEELEVEVEPGGFVNILETANMDGVRHLSTPNPRSRVIWIAVLLTFVCLAIYQIATQVIMYISMPIATNIEADYPSEISFPVVAICNNNQYRLTYLTGGTIQNRTPRNHTDGYPVTMHLNDSNVFDRALRNSWDMDAVKFLRYAAHWKSRMILGCKYPNGTRCRAADFKAVWTLSGLCWAINTDPANPVRVYGAGPAHSLTLLLNVERYERIEACTPKFRTSSLPGLKILIYNQTDFPVSSLEGVNVPAGYSMDIPVRMQHRQKLSGLNCIDQARSKKLQANEYGKSCIIKKYLEEVERQCACSMGRQYQLEPMGDVEFCNVEDYFTCVTSVLRWGNNGGFSTFKCLANCDEMDYTAWQDTNELPDNIFPKLIESADDDDESDIDDDLLDENPDADDERRDEHFKCENNQLLEDIIVSRIKREANKAYEKKARYQEDILLRTKRLIDRVNLASQNILEERWGWRNENFTSVYDRLASQSECFANMSSLHSEVFYAAGSRVFKSEELRAQMLVLLLGRDRRVVVTGGDFRTLADVKHAFGADVTDAKLLELDFVEEFVSKLCAIYNPKTYTSRLKASLVRMDRILELMNNYDAGKLQRRVWAEKMQSRNMRHFFDEDFYDGWYNIIGKDLDLHLKKSIADLDYMLPRLMDLVANNTGVETGAALLFGSLEKNYTGFIETFLNDVIDCTFDNVRNATVNMTDDFKQVMHDFQAAYTNLFKKELPAYLENFDFGSKFVKENFAHVKVFLHKMNIEHWKQSQTYSIWSLFCDVGGALGLFLGASLLTIIELIYLCVQYGINRNDWAVQSAGYVRGSTMNTLQSVRRASRRWLKPMRKRNRRYSDSSSDDEKKHELQQSLLPDNFKVESGDELSSPEVSRRRIPPPRPPPPYSRGVTPPAAAAALGEPVPTLPPPPKEDTLPPKVSKDFLEPVFEGSEPVSPTPSPLPLTPKTWHDGSGRHDGKKIDADTAFQFDPEIDPSLARQGSTISQKSKESDLKSTKSVQDHSGSPAHPSNLSTGSNRSNGSSGRPASPTKPSNLPDSDQKSVKSLQELQSAPEEVPDPSIESNRSNNPSGQLTSRSPSVESQEEHQKSTKSLPDVFEPSEEVPNPSIGSKRSHEPSPSLPSLLRTPESSTRHPKLPQQISSPQIPPEQRRAPPVPPRPQSRLHHPQQPVESSPVLSKPPDDSEKATPPLQSSDTRSPTPDVTSKSLSGPSTSSNTDLTAPEFSYHENLPEPVAEVPTEDAEAGGAPRAILDSPLESLTVSQQKDKSDDYEEDDDKKSVTRLPV